MSPINWDRELAKIEREFDGLPPEPRRPDPRVRLLVPEPGPAVDNGSPIAVWARLTLVASLPAALAFWPYARECGLGLYAFLGAGAMIGVGGIWVASCTWRNRMGFAHSLALGLVLAGLVVVGMQVLPRVGYARVDPSHPPRWQCRSSAQSQPGPPPSFGHWGPGPTRGP